jgi:hypothetical protein
VKPYQIFSGNGDISIYSTEKRKEAWNLVSSSAACIRLEIQKLREREGKQVKYDKM